MQNKFLNNAFNLSKNAVWKCTHKDAAKMLIGMGALGFILSSMAQCWAIHTNNRIDKKKKNFMLAQEAADGAVNVGLFLLVTSSVWKFSDKLLKLSGLATFAKNGHTVMKQNGKSHIKSGARIFTTMVASVVACNIITPLLRNVIAGKFRAYEDKKEQYLASLTRCVDKVNCKDSFKPFNDMKYANVKSFPHISSGSMKV